MIENKSSSIHRSKPLVSVVVPLYQAAHTIQYALQSVVQQDYRPIEIIIVNDGSTDQSLLKVEDFIQENRASNVAFRILSQPNQGVSSARNAGMRLAEGDYIALLDADDQWLPGKLTRQLAVLETHPQIDFLGTTRNDEQWTRWFFKSFKELTPISAHLLLYKTFFVTPTVIFKRSILNKTGYFDEQQRFAEEGNYWIRVCCQNHCVLLNESWVITGNRKPNFGYSGLSSNLKEMERGELKNMYLGYQMGIINAFEYGFLVFYSLIKYLRRIVITVIRRIYD